MSIVQHIKVLDSQLANIKIVAGSTIYTRDTGKHFIDISDTERVQISDIIYIDTDKERIALLAPLPDKLYITRDTNKVWVYSVKTDKWICLNIDTTYTAGTGISIDGTTINNSGVRAVTAGASANKININTNDNINTITIDNVANAVSASKATSDSVGQQINTTYIKGLSVSGKVITYTKGDGTTGTITTQDTDTWRGIQNVLTSDSTTDSLSAAQGKALKGLVDGKADKATTLSDYGITDAKISDGVITLGANSITPLTAHQSLAAYAKTADVNTALDKKANKATTLSGYGITDAKISDGTITLGSNTITPLTNHQSLANYYTKGAVDTLITNLKAGLVNVVESLPTTGENGKLYLVKTGSESENLYTEYVYVNKAWEKLGTQKLDLSGYLTKTDAANTYLGKTAAAASANKLNTNAGSATQPIYFANGVPVATTYTLGKSVPSDAKFTDTVYNHPTTHPASMITGLATVATSGSYADLSDKPTIPAAYSLPDATTSVKGGVKIGSNLTVSSGTLSLTKANVTDALGYTPPTTNTTYNDMTAATASTAGTRGLVPAPAAGKQLSFLRGDGTWVVPTNTTYPMVSSEVNGIMAASDKAKLDGIAENANNYSHPSSHPASMITGLATVATSGSYNDLTNKPAAYSLPDATASVKGGVKIGSNLTISSGTLSLTKANVTAALGYTPPTTDTNTTYSAGNGISLSGTTFSNSGVRSIATGSANGTISVNTNGTSADVAVKGLGSAAYTASSAYAAAGHTHNYAGSSSAGGAATKAIQDGDGKTISSTYAKLSGATFTGDVVMSAPYRDTYYASNLCRHFSQNTPNQFVIKTKIKYLNSTHMPVVRIYGYAYGLTSPIELRVGFYIYDNELGWAGVSCTGAWKPEVYLFSYTENSVKYVAIGFKGSCYFCGFQVDAQIGASGSFNNSFAIDGWSTTNNGSDTSISLIPSVGTDNCIKADYKPMQTDITGNASSATKATQDSAGQQINTTYIKGLSVSGKTITYTKGDGTTGTITTQDTNTTYSAGTGISLSGTTFSNAGVRSIAAGSNANQLSVNTGGTTATITINNVANATAASTATKATQDSAGQQINTTYIKGLSVSGKVITYTKGDGTTGTITTQDTNTWRGIQNVLTSDSTTDSLSAAQGKVLKGLVDGKANKATTLSGYGINNAYTKTEIDNKVNVRSSNTLPENAPDGTIIINPDENTNIINMSEYVKASEANTWTANQTMNSLSILVEKYHSSFVSGTSDNPEVSTMIYNATGAFTLNLSSLASKLSNSQAMVFSAYFKSTTDYTLSITNAGTIKYIGSASDVAISSSGMLLNILMVKDESSNLTSIIQANKLS